MSDLIDELIIQKDHRSTKTCPICSEVFTPSIYHPYQKCCSHKCSDKHWEKENPEKVREIRNRSNRKEQRRVYLHEYYRRWREKHPETIRENNRRASLRRQKNQLIAEAMISRIPELKDL